MTMIDWIILVIILLSTLISIWRGAVREIISLTTWVLAALVGFKYNKLLVHFYSAFTANESLQIGASFLTLVVLVVILGTLLGVALSKVTQKIGLAGLDRILGLGFGAARGVLMVSLAVLFAQYTELPAQEQWKNSRFIPQFEVFAGKINQWLTAQGLEPFTTPPEHT
jgi:membrane protein required for colicin V production